jgi:hypothetical protein
MSTLTTHTTASRDSHSVGLCKFNTTTNAIEVSDGTSWRIYDPDSAVGWSGTNAYSMNFDGTDDYLTMSPVTPTATQGTISAWVKIPSNGGGASIFSWSSSALYPTAQGTFRTDLRIASGKLYYFYQQQHSGSVVDAVIGNTTINDNAWHHVAVTSNGSAWSLYVDGSAETLTVTNGSNSGNWVGDLYAVSSSLLDICDIGAARRGSNIGGSSFFTGNIDEVAVWDSALSAAQINNIYKGESNGGSGGTNLTPGDLLSFSPNHWWRMGDGLEANSGSTVYDMSNNSVNATVVNATSGTNTSGAVYQAATP